MAQETHTVIQDPIIHQLMYDAVPAVLVLIGTLILSLGVQMMLRYLKGFVIRRWGIHEDTYRVISRLVVQFIFFVGIGFILHTVHLLRPYAGFYFVLLGTICAARLVNLLFSRLESIRLPSLKIKLEHYKFLKHILIGAIYFLGFIFALSTIPPLKALAFSILASSGILVTIAGFASQNAFSNIISGAFIELFNPFSIGDRIVFKGVKGDVIDITLRHTVIKTVAHTQMIVPNSVILNEIITSVMRPGEPVYVPIQVYIAYEADVEKALAIINEEIKAFPQYLASSKPVSAAVVNQLTPQYVTLKGGAWALSDSVGYSYLTEVQRAVKNRFDEAKIPFPNVMFNVEVPS